MKTLNTMLGMVLIMLSHGACRTSKSLQRQENRIVASAKTDLRIHEQDNERYTSVHSMADSSRQVYQVTIYPADTFKLSMQDGFTGKASRVEIRGSSINLSHNIDNMEFARSTMRESEEKAVEKVKVSETEKVKSAEKRPVNWFWLLGCAGTILLVIWIWRRTRILGAD